MPEPVYRKTIRHFETRHDAHELTFSCLHRRPLLTSEDLCVILSRSIDRAATHHSFALHAFVFMPEHVHLLVRPLAPDSAISKLLLAIKRTSSLEAKRTLEQRNDPLLPTLRLRGAYRFWQRGPGYDRNIRSTDTLVASIRYIHMNPVRRGICDHPSQYRWSSWRQHQFPHETPDPTLPRITHRR